MALLVGEEPLPPASECAKSIEELIHYYPASVYESEEAALIGSGWRRIKGQEGRLLGKGAYASVSLAWRPDPEAPREKRQIAAVKSQSLFKERGYSLMWSELSCAHPSTRTSCATWVTCT